MKRNKKIISIFQTICITSVEECDVGVSFTSIDDFLEHIDNPEEQRWEITKEAYLDMTDLFPDSDEVCVVMTGKNQYYMSFNTGLKEKTGWIVGAEMRSR